MSKKPKQIKYKPITEVNQNSVYYQSIHILDIAAAKALEQGDVEELLNVHDKWIEFAEHLSAVNAKLQKEIDNASSGQYL